MKKIIKLVFIIILILTGCAEKQTYQVKANFELLDNWKLTKGIIRDTESEREIIEVFKISPNDTFEEVTLEELNELFKESYDLESQNRNDIDDSKYSEVTVVKDICRLTNDSMASFSATLNNDITVNSFVLTDNINPSNKTLEKLLSKNIDNEEVKIRVSDNPKVVDSEQPLLPHAIYFIPVYKLVRLTESTKGETFFYDVYTPMEDGDNFASGYFVIARGRYIVE